MLASAFALWMFNRRVHFKDFGRRTRRWIAVGGLVLVTATITSLFFWIETHSPRDDGKRAISQPTATSSSLFPDLTGQVVDEARLLTENDERELAAELKVLEDRNTDQVVVVTVLSLRGYSIEEYGRNLGNHWGIGTREKNNGALLIVAPNEHKVRIEVGRGLEPFLTDEIAKKIIDKNIVPHFREGDYAGGIRDGVNAMLLVLASS